MSFQVLSPRGRRPRPPEQPAPRREEAAGLLREDRAQRAPASGIHPARLRGRPALSLPYPTRTAAPKHEPGGTSCIISGGPPGQLGGQGAVPGSQGAATFSPPLPAGRTARPPGRGRACRGQAHPGIPQIEPAASPDRGSPSAGSRPLLPKHSTGPLEGLAPRARVSQLRGAACGCAPVALRARPTALSAPHRGPGEKSFPQAAVLKAPRGAVTCRCDGGPRCPAVATRAAAFPFPAALKVTAKHRRPPNDV